jgi:sugar phosphate isomerase/epimerase
MLRSPLGINGGEYPHWPIEKICDLASSLKAQFVELAVSRIARDSIEYVRRESAAHGLTIHVNCATSELGAAMKVAHALESPIVVVFDDSMERTDTSRAGSVEAFRRMVHELLEQPGHTHLLIAMENQVIRITRQPEDLLALVRAVDHPRLGVNYDPDNYYNAGIEGFPYAYELVKAHIFHVHAKDSTRYIPQVHGDQKRVLHRAGGNVICVPLGTGAVNWSGLADRLRQDGYAGPISLEPHNLPDEMAPGMEKDAAFLRRLGLVD